MAVTNLHYITRMSSGFKVYILEGQPNMRTEDRYRHMTNEKARISPVYPLKRKHSPDRRIMITGDRCARTRRPPLALSSRQRVFRNLACSIQRMSSLSPTRSSPDSPTTPSSTATTSTWSPTPSPDRSASPGLSPAYSTPPMDEPLALIKKPRRDPERPDAKTPSPICSPVQVRPSVITRVPSLTCPPKLPCRPPPSVVSPVAYDQVVDEHFRRSLGVNYRAANSCQLSVQVSVDDHFAKALGDKWLQLKASTSSSPTSSSPITSSAGSRLSSTSSLSSDDLVGMPESPFTSCHPSTWANRAQAAPEK